MEKYKKSEYLEPLQFFLLPYGGGCIRESSLPPSVFCSVARLSDIRKTICLLFLCSVGNPAPVNIQGKTNEKSSKTKHENKLFKGFSHLDFLCPRQKNTLDTPPVRKTLRSNFNTREFNSRENYTFFGHNSESSYIHTYRDRSAVHLKNIEELWHPNLAVET